MKKIAIILTGMLCMALAVHAQDVNWRAVDQHKQVAAVRFGADYAVVAGLSYGQKISIKYPVIIGAEFSVPFGNTVLDDWKLKLAMQGELWHNDLFSFSLKPGIVARRFESDMARLYNLSIDVTTNFGYLRKKWGMVAEASYDRNLATHIRNGVLKENYAAIRDGWYDSTGGNFKFGIAANYSFQRFSIFLKAGKVFGQNFHDNPTIPFYADLSAVKYFGGK